MGPGSEYVHENLGHSLAVRVLNCRADTHIGLSDADLIVHRTYWNVIDDAPKFEVKIHTAGVVEGDEESDLGEILFWKDANICTSLRVDLVTT